MAHTQHGDPAIDRKAEKLIEEFDTFFSDQNNLKNLSLKTSHNLRKTTHRIMDKAVNQEIINTKKSGGGKKGAEVKKNKH